MPQSLSKVLVHLIFSTKHREPWITRDHEQRLWAYLGRIARQNHLKPLLIGGMEDHIHILLGMPPTVTVSEALKRIKGGSSGWIKENLPGCAGFGWQDGYAGFAVSKSKLGPEHAYLISSILADNQAADRLAFQRGGADLAPAGSP